MFESRAKLNLLIPFATFFALTLSTGIVSGESFKSPCGTPLALSKRVGSCLQPIFDVVEGRVDEDVQLTCNRFETCEKCIRTIAKECLSGLHKTSVGTIASSTKRFRSQECRTPELRAKYENVPRCLLKKGKDITILMRNHTAIEQEVFKLNIPPEEKLIKSCCTLLAVDRELVNMLSRDCSDRVAALVLGIIKGMTEDARNTLCHNPKCKGQLDTAMRVAKYKPPQNFIEPIMQILFELNTD